MALIAVGAKCTLPACEQVDFLPIRCRCNKIFCREHIFADDHACDAQPLQGSEPTEFADKLQRCLVDGCSKPSLHAYTASESPGSESGRVQALCARCHGAFCAAHRHPSSHLCVASEPTSTAPKNASAQALLSKHFPSNTPSGSSSTTSAAARTRKQPSDPKKLAQLQKVELMKMRHRAVPADPKDKTASLLVDQRLHVKVSVEGPDALGKTFWFRKSVGAGKALDLLATHMGISSNISPIHLLKEEVGSGERVSLQYDQPLADQISDGSTLVLVRPLCS